MSNSADSLFLKLSDSTPRLHEVLGSAEIEQLHQMFLDKPKMEPHHLRGVLRQFGMRFSDEQFQTLFLKVIIVSLSYLAIRHLINISRISSTRTEMISVTGTSLFH